MCILFSKNSAIFESLEEQNNLHTLIFPIWHGAHTACFLKNRVGNGTVMVKAQKRVFHFFLDKKISNALINEKYLNTLFT
jgi:hypothetical protein